MGRRSRPTRRWIRTAPTASWSTEILREAEETDRREDELYGEQRGDELPEQLRTPEGRRQRWRTPSGGSRSARASGQPTSRSAEMEVDPERGARSPAERRGGRREWFRVARRELEDAPGARRRGRSRVIATIACFRRRSAWRRTSGSTWPPTRPMSAGGRGAGPAGRVLKGNSKPFAPPELPEGRDQPLRPGLAGDAHPGHPTPAGLQRAGRGQRPAGHPRRRDHHRRAGLRASGADARHHAGTSSQRTV